MFRDCSLYGVNLFTFVIICVNCHVSLMMPKLTFLWRETICMKYQRIFSGGNKKNISKRCILKFYPVCKVLTKVI